MKIRKKFKSIVVWSIIVCITIILIIVLLFRQYIRSSPNQTESNQSIKKSEDLSTNKKTFTHEAGYSFSYPSDVRVTKLENSAYVVVRSTEEKDEVEDYNFDTHIIVLQNSDNLPLYDFVKKEEGVVNGQIPATAEYSGTPFSRKIIAFEEKLVDGKLSYLFHAEPCSICRGETYKTYIEQSPTQVISFDIFMDKTDPKPESYKLYDQILSTFQFQD